ncbi:MAG: DUF3050 domain-containing protein [Alphaproteobacteria bacterium]|nr:DUF3050 domain-containing protein [Alphaproteobacteria bacterium]PHX98343.1 MAG: hypothetical protein CK529_13650 [Rhodospirillaceae bacterium]
MVRSFSDATQLEGLYSRVEPHLSLLNNHPIYSAIKSLEDLRVFMTWHVFAVWDFMSLLKSLQRQLTCVDVPWMVPPNLNSARFINEIVLNEETDIDLDGSPTSHLSLYLQAMNEVGASHRPFELFIDAIKGGSGLTEALQASETPEFVSRFVKFTLECALNAQLPELASAFVFGRETLIPDMFRGILREWKIEKLVAPRMHYYLSRHVDIDGNQHGPASIQLLSSVMNNKSDSMEAAARYAVKSIQMRISLWDGLHKLIKETVSAGAIIPH